MKSSFNLKDFTALLNETTELIEKQGKGEDDTFKIESNIQALRIMGGNIQDADSRNKAEELIKGLLKFKRGGEKMEGLVAERRMGGLPTVERAGSGKDERSELVDTELFKNTLELKNRAVKFGDSLKSDRKVLDKLSEKMMRNSDASGRNTEILEAQQRGVKSSTYIYFAFIMFIVMYFFIRFF